jgi:hypothetical protein
VNDIRTITPAALPKSKQTLGLTIVFSAAILICWLFPHVWYTHANPTRQYFWLSEKHSLPGWTYSDEPVGQSAEAILVADQLVSGQFTNEAHQIIHVFSAKRFEEKQNEIGLFVHTPDRCWTESGWRIEPVAPEVLTLNVHGVNIQFERRIFAGGGGRELVYFCGLTGGQSLPYRLDHNLGVAMRYQIRKNGEKSGAALRASDSHLWSRVWESFESRRPLLGPKQFIRISTPLAAQDVAEADRLLQQFILQWLQSADFQSELQAWKRTATTGKHS